jgi:poly(3-hydroxybutyrate) depolymerase
VAGAGHYGIFSGRRWREKVYPEIKAFILRFNAPDAKLDHKPTAAELSGDYEIDRIAVDSGDAPEAPARKVTVRKASPAKTTAPFPTVAQSEPAPAQPVTAAAAPAAKPAAKAPRKAAAKPAAQAEAPGKPAAKPRAARKPRG